VSVPHALNEQARHVAYILDATRRRGASVVEATIDAEQSWCEEMRDKARLGVKFYEACTPGYYNNEGRLGNPNGFFAGMYGAGPIAFFRLLDEWRSSGDLPGLELRSAP
jgi:cyclohexanone monooxygenase